MGNSAVDPIALAVGVGLALVITVALVLALRGDNARRGWIVAAALVAALSALGAVDLLRHEPRETPFSNLVIGVVLPVLGTLGILRGTRTVRPWIRWVLAWITAFLLVFAGFLLGAVLASYLPF
jgi:hypothetical protein